MTAAQMKRAEIEKRQQAKLKQEAEEDDLRKKRKLQDLLKYRMRQQRILDKQTVRFQFHCWQHVRRMTDVFR
jgi:hypothetical protein